MTQKKRFIISLAAGIVAALCAALFLLGQAQSAAHAQAEILEQFEGGTQDVLVAKQRIESGTVLSKELFNERTWPGLYLPEGAVPAQDFPQIEGRRASATILTGEVLTTFRAFDKQLPLDRLAPGMTAVTLPADNVHALGGELLRGMHLTLMANAGDGKVVKLAQNIEVLSANTAAVQMNINAQADSQQSDSSRSVLTGAADSQSTYSRGESLHWVTLAIPNGQVEQILTASRAGTIHFVLPASEAPEDSEGE